MKKLHYALLRAKGIPVYEDTKEYCRLAEKIKKIDMRDCSREELVRAAASDDISAAFASINETVKRFTGLDPYPEQLAAGLLLCGDRLVQMQTGEGKTLSALFPAVFDSLHGHKIHVMTANDYLAERDWNFSHGIFRLYGLKSGYINSNTVLGDKKKLYRNDIVFISGGSGSMSRLLSI